jgi:hypothetical protein
LTFQRLSRNVTPELRCVAQAALCSQRKSNTRRSENTSLAPIEPICSDGDAWPISTAIARRDDLPS